MARISKSPEERKKELLYAAQELFFKKGFENCSVSDIVKSIGVAQGTFYYYFDSKDSILDALVLQYADMLAEKLEIIMALKELSPIEKMAKMLKTRGEFLSSSGSKIGSLIYGSSTDSINKKHISIIQERLKPYILKVFMEGNERGLIKLDYPEEIMELLFFMGNQILFAVNSGAPLEIVERKIKAFGEAVLKILSIPEGININFFDDLKYIKKEGE